MCALQRVGIKPVKSSPGRKLLALAFGAVILSMVLAFSSPTAASAEVISSFQSDIRIRRDSSIGVTETIVYDPQESTPHGFYRVFPLTNPDGTTCTIEVLSLTDQYKTPIPYSEARLGDDLSIRFGRPKSQTGKSLTTYVLNYEVQNAIETSKGSSELHWNATGDECSLPIDKAIVNVWYVDGAANNSPTEVKGSIGAGDSTRSGAGLVGKDAVSFFAATVNPGESFNVLVRFPEGVIHGPTLVTKVKLWLKDWWFALFFPLANATALGIVWWHSGRDEKTLPANEEGAIALVVPIGLTPAEVGTIIDETCDVDDVLSTIIDLAVRGCVRIREVERFDSVSTASDYEFERLAPCNSLHLAPHENRIIQVLFGEGDTQTRKVRLLELKQRFFAYLPAISAAIYQGLTDGGYFRGNPKQCRVSFAVLGSSIGFIGTISALLFHHHQTIAFSVALILAGLTTFCVAGAMPARTSKGSVARRQAADLQWLLRTITDDRLRQIAKQDPTIFQKMLPYALVLGAADEWTHKFVNLPGQQMVWFDPMGAPDEHMENLGRGLSSISSVLSAGFHATTRLKQVIHALGLSARGS